MKRWLALSVALGALLLFVSPSVGASKMEIKGVIANWKEVKARVPDSAFFQLVKIEDNLKGTSDEQGLSAFDSEFPKLTVLPDDSFRVDVKGLPEGKFFIALQRAMPKDMEGAAITSGTPILLNKEGKPVIIEVPGNFPQDVGRVVVAVQPQGAVGSSGKKK
jgi:hypothetical protein